MQTIWMTGFCQSGKTTLAHKLANRITKSGEKVEIIDGDMVRNWAPTGFDPASIDAHLRRVALMAHLLNKHGVYVIVPVISPILETRQICRDIVGKERFTLVHVQTPSGKCAEVDTKNLYNNPDIKALAGVDAPYDAPTTEEALQFIRYAWHSGVDVVDGEEVDSDAPTVIWKKIQSHRNRRSSLFVGRWQPMHNGHVYIIRSALDEGKRVVVGVRDTPRSPSDPYSFEEVKEMIYGAFRNDVEVELIPDIESINIGRKVGYDINRVDAPESIEGISATGIREGIDSGDGAWENKVPKGVADFLKRMNQ